MLAVYAARPLRMRTVRQGGQLPPEEETSVRTDGGIDPRATRQLARRSAPDHCARTMTNAMPNTMMGMPMMSSMNPMMMNSMMPSMMPMMGMNPMMGMM